jgi:DNA-binding NarL/FixJ family response regulator
MTDVSKSAGRAAVGVLICDDSAPMRGLLRAVIGLRPSLRVVGEAADGNEAIAEATRLQPDVILLDLAMPRRTGLDALSELRQVAPAAKIIVFSGFSASSVAGDVIELGAVLYLQKGAHPEAINDAIEAAAAQTPSAALLSHGSKPH